jgi:hypothetical protein
MVEEEARSFRGCRRVWGYSFCVVWELPDALMDARLPTSSCQLHPDELGGVPAAFSAIFGGSGA